MIRKAIFQQYIKIFFFITNISFILLYFNSCYSKRGEKHSNITRNVFIKDNLFNDSITRNFFISMRNLTSYQCVCVDNPSVKFKFYFFLSNIDTLIEKHKFYKFMFLKDTINIQKKLNYADYIYLSNDTIYYYIIGTFRKVKELSRQENKKKYDTIISTPFFIFKKDINSLSFKSLNTLGFDSLKISQIIKPNNKDSILYEISAIRNYIIDPIPAFNKMYVSPKYGIVRFEYQHEYLYDCIIE